MVGRLGFWLSVAVLASVAACSVAPVQTYDPTKGPHITAVQVPTTQVTPGSSVNLSVTVSNPEDAQLAYRWDATAGIMSNPAVQSPVWVAPSSAFGGTGQVTITVRVRDDKGREDSRQAQILVVNAP